MFDTCEIILSQTCVGLRYKSSNQFCISRSIILDQRYIYI